MGPFYLLLKFVSNFAHVTVRILICAMHGDVWATNFHCGLRYLDRVNFDDMRRVLAERKPKMTVRRFMAGLLAPIYCLGAASLAFAVWNAAAADERTIRFGIPIEGYPPYLMNKDKALLGIVGDAFVAISNSIGYKTELIIVPEKRLDHMSERGQLDAVAGAIEWEDDAQKYTWTEGIIKVSDNVVMTKAHDTMSVTVDDLKGKHVALMLGYTYPSLEGLIKTGSFRSTRLRHFVGLLRVVDAGRVDYGILDQNVANWIIREKKLKLANNLRFSQPGFDEVFYRIVL